MLLYVYIHFFDIFLVAFHQKTSFYHFRFFFFDEGSNVRNRILINQNDKSVIRNCQEKCMLVMFSEVLLYT